MPIRNVLFVLTDQQHFRTLGANGCPEARTPNLDKLAARSFNFANHIVANPVCSPSRASIMTGLYPTEHGLWGNGCRLDQHHDTIASVLAARGHQTAHFGKLHLVPILNRIEKHPPYGFERWEIGEGDQQLIDDDYFRWLRTDSPDLFLDFLTQSYRHGQSQAYTSVLPVEKHLSSWVTRGARRWLEEERDPDQPFLLSVGYFDPHHAFNPCEPYASQFAEAPVTPPTWREGSLETRPPHYRAHFEGCRAHTRDEEAMTATLRAYHAMCAHLDSCVGELLETLERLGVADETAIVFSSDHGELLGNHGLLWKGPYLLDDVIRVPLLIAVPGAQGSHVESLSSSVDLMATIQALAGVPAAQIERKSGRVLANAGGELLPDGERPFALCEWEAPRESAQSSLRCWRTRDWKLVHYNRADDGELYDLQNDPDECWNLFHDSQYGAVRGELEAQLSAHYLARRPSNQPECRW